MVVACDVDFSLLPMTSSMAYTEYADSALESKSLRLITDSED